MGPPSVTGRRSFFACKTSMQANRQKETKIAQCPSPPGTCIPPSHHCKSAGARMTGLRSIRSLRRLRSPEHCHIHCRCYCKLLYLCGCLLRCDATPKQGPVIRLKFWPLYGFMMRWPQRETALSWYTRHSFIPAAPTLCWPPLRHGHVVMNAMAILCACHTGRTSGDTANGMLLRFTNTVPDSGISCLYQKIWEKQSCVPWKLPGIKTLAALNAVNMGFMAGILAGLQSWEQLTAGTWPWLESGWPGKITRIKTFAWSNFWITAWMPCK